MKKILYLGLQAPERQDFVEVVHYPVIKIEPVSPACQKVTAAFQKLPLATHLLFTSKSAAAIFFECLAFYGTDRQILNGKIVIAIGAATAAFVEGFGVVVNHMPEECTSEGVVELLDRLHVEGPHLFWPHSAKSRPVIVDYLLRKEWLYTEVALYDTFSFSPGPAPELSAFDEIIFTSPSTVDGFLAIYGALPKDTILRSIGPVTEERLSQVLS